MTRILIYHSGALGDFITTFPALRQVRTGYDPCRIVFLGHPQRAALAREEGLVDEWLDMDGVAQAPLYRQPPSAAAEQILKPFDCLIAWCCPGSPLPIHARAAGVPLVLTQTPFPEQPCRATEYHLELVSSPGPCGVPRPEHRKRHDRESDASLSRRRGIIAIHPGSGSSLKNWPLSRFRAFAARAERAGHEICWILGPAEQRANAPLPGRKWENMALPELRHALSGCKLCVGNDSGISHLSAYANCPTIAVFGPSDARVWAPAGAHVRVVSLHLPCSPCHLRENRQRNCGRKCLEEIDVAMVWKAAAELLDQPVSVPG